MNRDDDATLVVPTETDPPTEVVDAWIHAALRRLPAPARLRAALVARELVADARGRRAAPYVLRLSVLDRRSTLAVAVDCATAADEPMVTSTELLVSGLCTRWGVERRLSARTTWAELTVDASGPLRLHAPDQPRPGFRFPDRRSR
ncbi:hypothetical protein [Actinophytocola xinjiangensis]|nr:hypothetical protein [Actinophytocola xinjiangensis]